jgi:hypothetical protein
MSAKEKNTPKYLLIKDSLRQLKCQPNLNLRWSRLVCVHVLEQYIRNAIKLEDSEWSLYTYIIWRKASSTPHPLIDTILCSDSLSLKDTQELVSTTRTLKKIVQTRNPSSILFVGLRYLISVVNKNS